MSKPMRVIRYNSEKFNRQYRKKRKIKIACAVVFGIAALILVGTSLHSMINDIMADSSVSSDEEYDVEDITFSAEDTFNTLVLGFGAESSDLDYATLISFSPATDDVKIVTFSDYTSSPSINEGQTLESIYLSHGKKGVVSMIETISGVTVGGTTVFDFYGTSNFFNLFGGTQVYLDQSISYTPSEGIMGIIAAEGKRKFSGRELIRLFLYRGWENGELDRTQFITRAFAAVIDENLSGGLKEQYDTLYQRITNTVQSDITVMVYSEVSEGIFYLAKVNELGKGICRVFPVLGEFDSSENKFKISTETIMNIRTFFEV